MGAMVEEKIAYVKFEVNRSGTSIVIVHSNQPDGQRSDDLRLPETDLRSTRVATAFAGDLIEIKKCCNLISLILSWLS